MYGLTCTFSVASRLWREHGETVGQQACGEVLGDKSQNAPAPCSVRSGPWHQNRKTVAISKGRLDRSIVSERTGKVDPMTVYCRGCGKPLENPRMKFHPDCMLADKRRRVATSRAKERERFSSKLELVLAPLQRMICPVCQQRYREYVGKAVVRLHERGSETGMTYPIAAAKEAPEAHRT